MLKWLIEKHNVKASSEKILPTKPLIKIRGINTAIKTIVVAIIAKATCLDPLYAATSGAFSKFNSSIYIFEHNNRIINH